MAVPGLVAKSTTRVPVTPPVRFTVMTAVGFVSATVNVGALKARPWSLSRMVTVAVFTGVDTPKDSRVTLKVSGPSGVASSTTRTPFGTEGATVMVCDVTMGANSRVPLPE
jgi:hypothetical protein